MTPQAPLHFADPIWLWGILFLPLAALAWILASRAKHSTFILGNPKLVGEASGILPAQWAPWLLRLLVLALCLIAAARPQAGKKKVEEKKPVTDLFMAFDVSTSMLTEDLKPNRVAAARKLLSEFLDKVQNVRVGLTVFAAVSFTQCPLTTDMAVVKQLLSHVDVFSVKVDGTAIGSAIISCLGRLEDGDPKKTGGEKKEPAWLPKWLKSPETSEEQAPNHQAIILLTDGGNNAGEVDPLTAAKIAASRGVKIYTIGVGSLKSVPAIYHINGQPVYGGIDPRTGRVFMSEPADLTLLKEISRITGGKSYSAQNNQSLASILGDIAQLEKRQVSTLTHWEYQELAPYFLLAAFLLLMLDFLLETTVLRTLP